MNDSSIVVALDFSHSRDALALVDRIDPERCKLKVGKELFCRAGPALVKQLVERGFPVFLDLKFHDIPNTVAGACSAAVDLGVWMLDVHASGGRAMLEAARRAVWQGEQAPRLIAVTVLTSMGAQSLNEVGVDCEPEQQVGRLAALTRDTGLDGVVCSAREIATVRELCGEGFLLVTPGIRPAGAALNDQTRVVTPGEALSAGSDFLVIGRPITAAPDPMAAILGVEEELKLVQ